ncbi:MAG: tetratricopeptide repeat protein [Spirochaetales bacterium]|nr:tetratricopeptide repeat protein [Spirochaetales bacterium]
MKAIPLIIILLLCPLWLVAQKIDMDNVEAEFNFRLGLRSYHMGNYNSAILYFEKALSFKPEIALQRYWLAQALYKSGFEEAAMTEWRALLEIDPSQELLDSKLQFLAMRRGGQSDEQNQRLVVVRELDGKESDFYHFLRPSSIRAVDRGLFYLTAWGSNEVIRLDINYSVMDVFRGGITGFDHPFDVVETPKGDIFISEFRGDLISKCSNDGVRTKTFGTKGTGPGQLIGPKFMAFDPKGYLYVSDYGNRRVNKYDEDGAFILSMGGSGAHGFSFKAPSGIVVTENQVIVADSAKKLIAFFDKSGNFLKSMGEGTLWGPEGMSFVRDDRVLVTDSAPFGEKTRILELRWEKESFEVLSDLTDKSARLLNSCYGPNGNLYSVDFDKSRLLFLSNTTGLYSGIFVEIERIDASAFPQIYLDVVAEDPLGNPLVGLKAENFRVREFNHSVADFTFFEPPALGSAMELAVVVEKSEALGKRFGNLDEALVALVSQKKADDRIVLIEAGETPSILAQSNQGLIKNPGNLLKNPSKNTFYFDRAIRLAGSTLIPQRKKRVVLYLTEGYVDQANYKDYSLMDLAAFYKNNHICFHVLTFGTKEISADLAYLVKETHGKVYGFFDPQGVSSLREKLDQKYDSRYILGFNAVSDDGFGRKLLEVETEVSLWERSGRAESAYFAPER